MKQNNYCSFLISFIQTTTSNIQLQCSFVNHQNEQEEIIHLPNQTKDFYPITIAFDINEILVCQENNKNNIHFIEDLINKPNEYQQYSITYQRNCYSVIAEILLAFIIKEFKKQIEKEYTIQETIFDINSTNGHLINRITTALEICGFKNIVFKPINFNYLQQIDLYQEIIKKKEEYEKSLNQLHKAQQYVINDKQKKQLLSIDNSQVINEETIYKIGLSFTTKEKEAMKLYKLDNRPKGESI